MNRRVLHGIAVVASAMTIAASVSSTPAAADTDSGTVGTASIVLSPATTSGYPPGHGVTIAVSSTSTTPGLSFSYFKATVTVDGRPVSSDVFVSPAKGLTYRRAWGRGIVGLTDVTGSGIDSRGGSDKKFFNEPTAASVQPARVTYGVHYRSRLQVKRSGDRLRFTVRARYLDSHDRAVGIRRASIEVFDRGRWRTLRHLRLDRHGVGRWQRATRTRHTYRLVIASTTVYGGKALRGTRKV